MTEPRHGNGGRPVGRNEAARALIVMARAPRQGTVKTRLARDIGEEAALAVYRELAEQVLGELRAVRRCVRVLQYTPADAHDELRDWARDAWRLAPQCDGSLGDRMGAAMAERYAAGAERVVIVGTDCPAVDEPLVEAAFAAMAERDVVFGPAHDGGYYLVGARREALPEPRHLFAAVPWSSADTLAANVARAQALGLSVALLPTHRDVDSRDDLEHWRDLHSGRPASTDRHRG